MAARDPVPAPGIVLGPYPEKPDPDTPAPWQAGLMATWAALPPVASWRERALRAWVARVRIAQAQVPPFPGRAFRDALLGVRAEMARDGFDSPACERACAFVAQAITAVTGLQLRDSQLMAAHVVLSGRLAEMPTGSGKTLATALAATVAALAGVPVHVLSANDYLAQRDCDYLRPLFRTLGLSAASIAQAMKRGERRSAYACDIVYCSAKELVFDWLRDSLLPPPVGPGPDPRNGRVLRGLCMAIVDEADSVLIDEANTPFVLSESYAEPGQIALCRLALSLAERMQEGLHYRLDERRAVTLGDAGKHLIATFQPDSGAGENAGSAAQDNPLWAVPRYRQELVGLAIQAIHVFQRDRHYIVRDGKVHIVDATTGRVAEGRSWSRGLQQLIELREGCQPSPATRVIAQVTYPRLFPRYLKLGGMSGTLTEARAELLEVYGLAVDIVPSGHPRTLRIAPPQVFARSEDRLQRLLASVQAARAAGRPVLIGTDSVGESEKIARLLAAHQLPHQVLNARQDRHEAEIVAQAGATGQLTVTTNMAGRGTDVHIPPQVAHNGGLHVVSCQHSSSRRIDRQLFGRAARQGQPGSAETLLALDEGLLATHLPAPVKYVLRHVSRAGLPTPLVLARAVTRFTQVLEERRLRRARAVARWQDQQQSARMPFGMRSEAAAPESDRR